MRDIKCFDTTSRKYVTVEVDDEIYTFIKRSYWREDMQDRRYQKRKLLFDEAIDYAQDEDLCMMLHRQMVIEKLLDCIKDLDERSQKLLYYRYYEEYSLRQIADLLGISQSYTAKVLKKVLCTLKDRLE